MSEVEQYEREAAETRERLRTSVEEIQRRLTPANILQNAKDTVRDTVSSTVRGSGGDAVKSVRAAFTNNPLVLLGLGVAVALFVYRRASRRGPEATYSDDEYSAYADGDSYLGDRDSRESGRLARSWTQVRSGVSSAGERLGAAGDRVRSGLDSARTSATNQTTMLSAKAGERLRSAGRDLSEAASGASHAASDAVRQGGELARDNPALVVGIGLAAGITLALLSGEPSESNTDDPYRFDD